MDDKESNGLESQPEGEPKEEKRGGFRPGSGAKPSWFREEARKALAGFPPYSKNKIKYLSDVAEGSEYDHRLDKQGEIKSVPIAIRDRLKALEMLGKWAALETVKIEGGDEGTPINFNPYQGVTAKEDLATLEAILKRAGARATSSADPQG